MHPVNYLFEEIYRDHWGFPHAKPGRVRRSRGLSSLANAADGADKLDARPERRA